MKTLRTGVVGVGYLGNFHAQKHQALAKENPSQYQFVGVFDAFADTAKAVSEKLQCHQFLSLQEMVGQVDAVTIATSTPHHFSVAEFLLKNGIHVLVEKPIASEIDQAKALLKLAAENSLHLFVGHSERFNPAYIEFKKNLKSSSFVELRRLAPFKKRGSEVSVIHDLMIHDLDLLLELDHSGFQLVEAQAGKVVSDSWDWACATFRFNSGKMAVVHASRLSGVMVREARAYNSDNMIVADLQTGKFEKKSLPLEGDLPLTQTIDCGRGDNLFSETQEFFKILTDQLSLSQARIADAQAGVMALELVEKIENFVQSKRA